MKNCRYCEILIPDHSHRCPHCRGVHPRGNWFFQAFLVAVVAATAAAVIFL